MTGFLGEVAFERTFKQFDYVGDKSYTHDYEYKGLKVDVKAKSCNTPPKLNYNASVVRTRFSKFEADVYFFMRVHKGLRKVWLCGWSPKKSIIHKKRFNERGERDADGFRFKADGYNIEIKRTRRPDCFRVTPHPAVGSCGGCGPSSYRRALYHWELRNLQTH